MFAAALAAICETTEASRGILPFVLALVAVCLLVMLVPQLVLWLPNATL